MKRSLCFFACLAALALGLTGCQQTTNSADASSASASSSVSSSASSASSSADASTQETAAIDYSVGLTQDGLYDGYTALDYVVLPENYDNIPSGEEFTTVSDEDLQDAIDQFLAGYAQDDTTPELTDDFVQEYLSADYGFTTAAEAREQFTAELLDEQQYNYVMDWIFENSEFTVPDKLVEDQVELLRLEMENAADYYGITVDEMAAQYGMDDLETLLESYRPALEDLVKQNLVCQAIAEAAGITVDEQAVSDYFSDVLGISDYSSYVDSYGQGYVYQGVRSELAAQYLIDHVTE